MSHKLLRHSILSDARVWDFLKQVDAAEAQACREAGCPRCGSALHSATYPRKPHGLAAELRDDVRRFSLCCSVCRRRVKPASVRFFGRRFYVGALFVVVSALAVAGGVRLHGEFGWASGERAQELALGLDEAPQGRLVGGAMDAVAGGAEQPGAQLRIGVGEVAELAQRDERAFEVLHRRFHPTLGEGCQLQPIRIVSSRLYASPIPSIRCSGVASSC